MKIPDEVGKVIEGLKEAGFEAYIVGGCVRDLILGKTPKDWDITTNAKPEEIMTVFPNSFYENDFGTVGVKTDSADDRLKIIEITTYRVESKYSDKRHPNEVKFAKTLESDLKRRDFTINALAMTADGEVTDLFSGRSDLENKVIRAVGEPSQRLNEDALRMMRAVRLSAELGFKIEEKTKEAITRNSSLMKMISQERIRDELIRTVNSPGAYESMELLRETGLMEFIIPELLEGIGVDQNLHHIYTVWEHNMRALKYTVEKNYIFEVRLGALLHDIGKPKAKRGEGYNSTFYGHEVVGARMTQQILGRLKFSKEQIDKITKLVRWHLFYYNIGEVTESSVRRLVANIGRENVEDLLRVREADRIGSGTPKAVPYKLRHMKFMIDKVARDPISPKMLKIKGDEVMKILKVDPGPKIGAIINALMDEILDDPSKNTKKYLEKRIGELGMLSEEELQKVAREGKMKVAKKESAEVEKIKQKHFVK